MDDWYARSAAAEAVGGLGRGGSHRPHPQTKLVKLLRDEDWKVRRVAAEAMSSLGGAAATDAVLRRLARLLRDVDWRVQWGGSGSSGWSGRGKQPQTPSSAPLAELLRAEDWAGAVWRRRQRLAALAQRAATAPFLNRLAQLLRG